MASGGVVRLLTSGVGPFLLRGIEWIAEDDWETSSEDFVEEDEQGSLLI